VASLLAEIVEGILALETVMSLKKAIPAT